MISQPNHPWRHQLTLVLLAALVSIMLAGCSQPAPDPTPTAPSAAAVDEFLNRFRQFGGTIVTLDQQNPTSSTTVSTVGTTGAYDLTQGDPPCAGFVEVMPTLVVQLDAQAATLEIAFAGDTMSTLMVVDEEEIFYCDENAALTTEPTLTVTTPKDHLYAIYVGRTDMQQPAAGALTVTITP